MQPAGPTFIQSAGPTWLGRPEKQLVSNATAWHDACTQTSGMFYIVHVQNFNFQIQILAYSGAQKAPQGNGLVSVGQNYTETSKVADLLNWTGLICVLKRVLRLKYEGRGDWHGYLHEGRPFICRINFWNPQSGCGVKAQIIVISKSANGTWDMATLFWWFKICLCLWCMALHMPKTFLKSAKWLWSKVE